MRIGDVLMAGQRIIIGRRPVLSIEITRECPLHCPGCYAYEEAHLGGSVTLRDLNDRKGDDLVQAVLDLVEAYQPLQLYIVGGDPLVRHRELDVLLPRLSRKGIVVQVVTSAFRPIAPFWKDLPGLRVTVSIDGLQPEHDARRAPATYERILKNIAVHRITVHCTITGLMLKRTGYLEEFLRFWSLREEVEAVRMSMFTPQRGADSPECLSRSQRDAVIQELLRLRELFPKLDMGERLIKAFAHPPSSPAECLFAQVTETLSADFKTRVAPCQFGGDPDCSRCGCMASVGLEAIATHRLGGLVPVRNLSTPRRGSGRSLQTSVRPWPLLERRAVPICVEPVATIVTRHAAPKRR